MKQSTRFSKSLAAYSLLATAFLGNSENADAQIIYTNIEPDDSLLNFSASSLDMDNDGNADYFLHILSASSTYRYDYINAAIDGSVAVDGLSVLQLHEGYNICSQFDWDVPQLYQMRFLLALNLTTGGAVLTYDGLWQGGVENGYIGLRFKSPGNPGIHYGWVRLSVSPDGSSMVIKDYAYNATPGGCIVAGEGSYTGISAVTSETINVYPNPAVNRIYITGEKLSDAKISILDLSGRTLMVQQVDELTKVLDVSALEEGFYLMRADTNEEILIRKFEVRH